MPAINPSVLYEQIDALLARPLEQISFPQELRSLLSYYADRTKRSSAVALARDPAETMRVPAAVLRALCNRIHRRGRRLDDEWLGSANQLWASGVRELRQVGICMLHEAPINVTDETATSWAAVCDDREVLRALAREGLQSWRNSDPDRLLEAIGEWVSHDTASVRGFGLMALLPLVEDHSFTKLPAVFDLLVALPSITHGIVQEALQTLLAALADRSPAEATAFLLGELERDDRQATRLIREILDDFPTAFQSELRRAL